MVSRKASAGHPCLRGRIGSVRAFQAPWAASPSRGGRSGEVTGDARRGAGGRIGAKDVACCSREALVARTAIRAPGLPSERPSMPPTTLDPQAARFLRAVRDAQFADGLRCVHCDSSRVLRWGRSHGRQRYRCRACRRTFSDLTGTPYYYSKRLERWPRFMACLESSVTVRASAALLRLHPCTTFRWRHRMLDAALAADVSRLTGLVELSWTRMWHSSKGQPKRYARRYPIHVLWARDRHGRSAASWQVGRRYADQLDTFADVVDPAALIVNDEGPLSGAGRFARLHTAGLIRCTRHSCGPPSSSLAHLANVRAEMGRFRGWLPRFRGVATKYLDNYLVWHRCLDASAEVQAESRWVHATSPPPTLPANGAAASGGLASGSAAAGTRDAAAPQRASGDGGHTPVATGGPARSVRGDP